MSSHHLTNVSTAEGGAPEADRHSCTAVVPGALQQSLLKPGRDLTRVIVGVQGALLETCMQGFKCKSSLFQVSIIIITINQTTAC